MWHKIGLYIFSLFFLFALIFAYRIEWPSEDVINLTMKGEFDKLNLQKWPFISVLFMIYGLLYFFYFKHVLMKSSNDEMIYSVDSSKLLNFEALSFLSTYLIPLLSFDLDFDLDQKRNTFMFFAVIFLIGLVYIKARLYFHNPTLAIWGFKIFLVNEEKIVLSRNDIISNQPLKLKKLSDNHYIALNSN